MTFQTGTLITTMGYAAFTGNNLPLRASSTEIKLKHTATCTFEGSNVYSKCYATLKVALAWAYCLLFFLLTAGKIQANDSSRQSRDRPATLLPVQGQAKPIHTPEEEKRDFKGSFISSPETELSAHSFGSPTFSLLCNPFSERRITRGRCKFSPVARTLVLLLLFFHWSA